MLKILTLKKISFNLSICNIKVYSTFLYFFLLLIISNYSFSQSQFKILDSSPLKFEKINPEEGLIHNSVTTIYQDSKGYMWFGSFNGLYKYDGYNFKIYKTNSEDANSLIGNDIAYIHEDSYGKLWIGTSQGLCFYNRNLDNFSRSLTTIKTGNTFTIKNRVNTIHSDTFSTLWVGTDNGLFQLVHNNDAYDVSLHQYNKSTPSISNNIIKAIVEDKHNNLWVATEHGLNKIIINRQGDLVFNHFFHDVENNESLTTNDITKLCIDKNENLWVGTRNGLNKLSLLNNSGENKFTRYQHDRNSKNSLSDNHVTAITQDYNNDIWIGTRYGGVNKYLNGKFSSYKKSLSDDNSISSNEISSIYSGKNGVLWFGVIAGRVNKLDLNKNKIAHFKFNAVDKTSLSDNIVNVVYEDSKKNIWVGTHNGGLNKLEIQDGKTNFQSYKNNVLSSNNVFSFCEDNYGNYWVGTEDKGLNFINGNTFETSGVFKVKEFSKELNTLPSNNISILYKDHIGDIWMGSFDGDGLMKLSPSSNGLKELKIQHFKNNPKNKNSIPSNHISCIYEDSKNRLWVGTYGTGLIRIIRDENNNPKEFIQLKKNEENVNSLSNDNVFSVLESTDGNLWVATFGGGLNKIAKEEIEKSNPEIVKYREAQGLTNEELYGVLEDDNNHLWISSNRGVYKFDPKQEIFTNFQTSDGFQALNFRKFAFHKGHNGIMYFGGINGFNAFSPEQFEKNEFLPDVELVDLKIFNASVIPKTKIEGEIILNKSISQTKELTLRHIDNAFTLEFSALHYTAPSQNQYKYILEGFDKTWNATNSDRRYATYSNLDAGTYIFKVIASNNDLVWSETPKTITINVLPPWWKTWWAYLIYISLIIGLMFVFRHFLVKNNEYQNKLKIEKIEQENIKNINAVKLEFFTNISHEFKTPLTLVLGPLQQLINSGSVDSKIKNTLLSVEKNAKNLYKLINQVLEFRKIEAKETSINATKGDLVHFIEEVVNSFYFLAESGNINLKFNSSESSVIAFFDWDKLEKVMNNLISNSIKYTPENGLVNISLGVSNENKSVKITVKDNGIGIPKNQLAFIFNRFYQISNSNRSSSMGSGIGLALSKVLIELHKGTIKVKSKEHKGTIFKIEFPLIESNSNVHHETVDSFDISDKLPEISTNTLFDIDKISTKNTELPVLLIVEDNLELQTFIKSALDEFYNVIQALNGETGIELALKEVPDIIISDIMMPKKDGIELCDTLKKNPVTNHIPIVLLTARASIEHRIEGLEVGADSYIAKPFHIKHLTITLEKLLKQRQLLKEKFSLSASKSSIEKSGANKFEVAFINQVENIITENIQNSQFGVTELGEALNFSRMQLYRKLKSISDMSANEFIRNYRVRHAAKLMEETEMNVSQIAYEVGFNNLSYFTKCFKQTYGSSPSKYLKEIKK